MNLDTMTIEQLKALAYDLIVKVETNQRDLQVVNARIAKLVQNEIKEELKPD